MEITLSNLSTITVEVSVSKTTSSVVFLLNATGQYVQLIRWELVAGRNITNIPNIRAGGYKLGMVEEYGNKLPLSTTIRTL